MGDLQPIRECIVHDVEGMLMNLMKDEAGVARAHQAKVTRDIICGEAY
jgi:hypothetical protein